MYLIDMEVFMRIIRKAVSIITIAFTAAVILCACIFCVPRLFGYTPYVVLSGSMEPVIHTGSVAFVNTRDTDAVPNDVVAYNLDGTIVLHRIISETTEGFITMGDANEAPDANPVEKQQVVGTFAFSIPAAGYLLSAVERHPLQSGPFTVATGILMIIGMVILLNTVEYFLSECAEGSPQDPQDMKGGE